MNWGQIAKDDKVLKGLLSTKRVEDQPMLPYTVQEREPSTIPQLLGDLSRFKPVFYFKDEETTSLGKHSLPDEKVDEELQKKKKKALHSK